MRMEIKTKPIARPEYYDVTSYQEYFKKIKGLIFSYYEQIHSEKIGSEKRLVITVNELPDKVYINDIEYSIFDKT